MVLFVETAVVLLTCGGTLLLLLDCAVACGCLVEVVVVDCLSL